MVNEFKKRIDALDAEIITLIARRMELNQEYIEDQRVKNKELHLKTRVVETLDKAKLRGNALGLRDGFIADLYGIILNEQPAT